MGSVSMLYSDPGQNFGRTSPLFSGYTISLSGRVFGEQRGGAIRPGTAGLLIGIECFRVRDSSWMYLTSFVITRIGIELLAIQRKLPDCVVVGF